MLTREEAKLKAMSRDCHCVNGKDRDNNFNEVIDEIFEAYEDELQKIHNSYYKMNKEYTKRMNEAYSDLSKDFANEVIKNKELQEYKEMIEWMELNSNQSLCDYHNKE